MIMRILIFQIALVFSATVMGQRTITLFECQDLARENAPRLADLESIRQMGDLKIEQAVSSRSPFRKFPMTSMD
jgi:hypothetical protein